MKLKYKINSKLAGLMMAGATLSGCKMSENFIVDGKFDNKVVIHSVAAPTDTTVVVFNGNYAQFLKNIYVGDTIAFFTCLSNSQLRNNVIHLSSASWQTPFINGERIDAIDVRRSLDSKRRELTRQVMQTTEKTK